MQTFTVKNESQLLSYLFDTLSDWQKKTIKQYLKHGSITVNEQIVTRFDHLLRPGDLVTVAGEKKQNFQHILKQSAIHPVYEDSDLLVVDKPPGLLTIASERVRTETLYYKITDYVRIKSGDKRDRVFIVHRLDQNVSGLIVFAKNDRTKYALQDAWNKTEKKYYAIVEGCPKKEQDEIRSYLAEDASHRVYSAPKGRDTKLAITEYKVLRSGSMYSLLEIKLVTGRKNQIRVHLSDIGCPIAGDKKYGAEADPMHRVLLHSFFLSFQHPTTGKILTFETPLPPAFRRII